jgi:lipopolysaccharide export system protein LptA
MSMRTFPFLVVLAAGAAAAETPEKSQELERLDSWADQMVYHSKEGKFHLTGHVIVIKGNLRVNCKEMVGTVDPKTRQMTRVVAIGDVEMLTLQVVGEGGGPPGRAPWRGKCSRADYDLKRNRVEMKSAPGTPRPRIWRAKGYGEADTIIFYPQQGEYELVGNPVIRGDIPTGPAGTR